MQYFRLSLVAIITLIFLPSCNEKPKEQATVNAKPQLKDSVIFEQTEPAKDSTFLLDEENAIDFFFDYAKRAKETKVRLTTSMGVITIELYDNVPYHKANFIYLAKQGYFKNTMFHRVVKGFIIQGGNADNKETSRKRKEIGRYLLPPDTRKGHKHHRGTISMPSSERDNPHKLASPYEFFIVATNPGSYHLDGSYTPFGRVVEGLDVVDKINAVEVDSGDWPMQNIYILEAEAF